MQHNDLHKGSKEGWRLLHTDNDLEAFLGSIPDWDEPYPEPILVEM